MATEPSEPTTTDFTDLPIQPTGSGAVDAEIAHMQSILADETGSPIARDDDDATGVADAQLIPGNDGSIAESRT